MAGQCLIHLGVILCVLSLGSGQDNVRALVNQINLLEKDINEMKIEVPRYETRIINKIGMLETVLRHDLVDSIVPSYIRSHVQTSLTQILGDQTIAAMFNSHFKTELRHLKVSLQQRIRQLQNYVDGEREKQRQETAKLRQEVAAERQYVERQLTYLQAELAVARNDFGRVEQEVSFLMNVWLNNTYGSPGGGRPGSCDCSGLTATVDSHKAQIDRKLQVLESEDVFLFKSIVNVNKSRVEDMITIRNDVQNLFDNNKEGMKTVAQELNMMVIQTKSKLNKVASATTVISDDLKSVCSNMGMECVVENMDTDFEPPQHPSFPEQPPGGMESPQQPLMPEQPSGGMEPPEQPLVPEQPSASTEPPQKPLGPEQSSGGMEPPQQPLVPEQPSGGLEPTQQPSEESEPSQQPSVPEQPSGSTESPKQPQTGFEVQVDVIDPTPVSEKPSSDEYSKTKLADILMSTMYTYVATASASVNEP